MSVSCVNGCGRSTDRPSGECFGCHARGVSFGFVGGGSYGRRAFHEHTNAEVIRDAQRNAELQGRTIEPKTNWM